MKRIYYILLSIIVLLSFKLYSTVYYANLNSDHAVPVLMIHYFNWPADIYYWGQDRIGSLIPLIAQALNKGFNISAIWSESIVHYFILILGFFAIASFFKSPVFKLLFACIWFLPPYHFIDTIILYSAVEYSFIGIACYLVNWYLHYAKNTSLFHQWLILFGIIFSLIIAIWVSDMAIVSSFVLILVLLLFNLNNNRYKLISLLSIKEFYATIFGVLLAYVIISYAKSNAAITLSYSTLNSFEIIFKSIKIFTNSLIDVFLFQINEPFTSVFSYLSLFIIGIIVFNFKRVKNVLFSYPIASFFLLETFVLFIAIIVSQWTFLNGVPRRYFTCTYLSLAISCLLVLQHLTLNWINIKNTKKLLIVTVVIGAISGIYNIGWVWPKTFVAKTNTIKQLDTLGKIGIIGEYWNSYIYSSTNPTNIVASPNDQCQVRNYAMVDSVFKQKDIYILKDCWLKDFPDTLKQFNKVLIKNGNEIHLADCNLCKYRVNR